MSKLLLIDGDMIAYRSAASCEPTKKKPERETLEQAIYRVKDLLYRIHDSCASKESRIFISGDRNFRKQLYPEYKANRDGMPRPVYLDACRSLLEREWNAEKCNGYEADDGIGMAHSEHTIIVSNDKDFRQLEGEIFNPIKNGGQFEMVDSQEAAHTFYSQLLEGDTSDNVRGIDGLGKVLSRRYLEGCTPEEMHSKVFCRYGNPERFFLNYRLLRILRTEEEWREVENQLSESKGPQVTTDCQGLDSESLSTVDTP